jgi:hypothetical protein
VTACDSYSAMTTDRSYRKRRSPADALAELERCSGSQFDPQVVATLRQMIPTGNGAGPSRLPPRRDATGRPQPGQPGPHPSSD